MEPSDLLARLRDPAPGGHLDRLADVIVDDLLARPLRELLEPRWTAEVIRDGLRAWLAAPGAEARLLAAIEDGLRRLEADGRPLSELLPREVVEGIRGLSDRPYTPDGRLLRLVLDREPVRAIIRDLLVTALVGFAKKLGSPVTDNAIARGLGGLGRMAREQAKARSGAIGAFASALSDEVERQAEKRAVEFADQALSGVVGQLIERLTRPGTSAEQHALRDALLDSVLALRGPELAAEVRRADPALLARSARELLTRWAAREDLVLRLEAAVAGLLAREGGRPLGETLESMELRGPARAITRDALARQLRPLVGGEAFGAWVREWAKA